MSVISNIRARLDRVPLVLRIAALASIAIGIVFPLAAVIPGGTFNLSGTKLSWRELWETRVALALLTTGPLMLFVGVAILRRERWVRPILVVLPILQFLPFQVVHWAFSAPNPTPSLQAYLVSIGVWALAAALYLFGFTSARTYFTPGNAAA